MFAHHCDREGCDTWQRLDTDAPQFTTVTFPRTWTTRDHHFCTLDCLMHWAATHSMPTEVQSG